MDPTPPPNGFEAGPFKVLVENLPGIVYRCLNDPQWTMEFISPYVEVMTGHPASAFLEGRLAYADLIHPEDRDRVWREVQEALADRHPFRLEYRLLHAAGPVRWVREDGRGVFRADGSLHCLDGVVLDYTEQVEAEHALRTSEEHLRMALRAARMGAWRWERGAPLVRTEKVDALFGFPMGAPGLRLRDFLARLDAEDRARLSRAIATEEVLDLPLTVRSEGQGLRRVRAYARLVKDAQGQVLMAMGTLRAERGEDPT